MWFGRRRPAREMKVVPSPVDATLNEADKPFGEGRGTRSGLAGCVMKAIVRPWRRAAEPLLGVDDVTAIGARLGWRVAAAWQPGSWGSAAEAQAVLLLLRTRDLHLAAGLPDGRPMAALLLDAPAGAVGDGRVLAYLLACGFDDVLLNFGSKIALEAALSMSLLRCRHTGPRCIPEDPWCQPSPGVAELQRPGAVDRGVNTDVSMHDGRPRPASATALRRGPSLRVHSKSERRPTPPPPPRRSPLDGVWAAVVTLRRVDGRGAPSQWARTLVIDGLDVVLGDGGRVTIDVVGGRWRLVGGELELVGETLLRHGRTAITQYRRLAPAPRLAAHSMP